MLATQRYDGMYHLMYLRWALCGVQLGPDV